MRIQKTLARIHLAMNSDRGATAVEYGLIVSLIALVIIGAVFVLGGNLTGIFEDVSQGIAPRGATG